MFEVDAAGLRKIVERQGLERLVLELISNALDEPGVTTVNVTFEPVLGRGQVVVTVEDDAPEGFVNLRDAWTLFGDTRKRANPETRGRFNLGEKLVIAACSEAEIKTTTGCVRFAGGKRSRPKCRTERGSIFRGVLRMTREVLEETRQLARRILPPATIKLFVDGTPVQPAEALAAFSAYLQTEVADEEGFLRRTFRTTPVAVHPNSCPEPYLFEMGIPVCPIPGDWSIDVHQKVPLNMDRDNVPPAYLRRLQALALNALAAVEGEVTEANAREPWVKGALESPDITPAAVTTVLRALYGEKVITRDPSDPEAVHRCIAHGYRVIEPGSFSASAWENIRRAKAALPAGQVMPTQGPKVASAEWLSPEHLTDGMKAYRELCQRLSWELMNTHLTVCFYSAPEASTLASWRHSSAGHPAEMRVNVGRLGDAWFDRGLCEEVLDLFLHEAGHEYASNHLSSEYHDACTKLGAKLAIAVRDNAGLLYWGV